MFDGGNGLDGIVTMYDGSSWVVVGNNPHMTDGPNSGELLTFPAAQIVATLLLPFAGLWSVTAAVYIEDSVAADVEYTVTVDLLGVLKARMRTKHDSSGGQAEMLLPVTLTASFAATAGNIAYLRVERSTDNGVQLANQARIEALLVR